MKYFMLFWSVDPRARGSSDIQAETLYSEKRPYADLGPFLFSKIPEGYLFPEYKLKKRAKLTDLLSANTILFPKQALISEFFFVCLQNFSAPSYQTFPATVFDKKQTAQPYFVILQNNPLYDAYDFEKSRF